MLGYDSRLSTISRQFLCCTALKDIHWNGVFEEIDWDAQRDFINATANHPKNIDRPIRLSYQKAFIKYAIDNLGKHAEINDAIYDVYGRLVSSPDGEQCYRHYVMNDGRCITIKETASFISEGTTGLSTWQAGVALAEWCVSNKNLFSNKTVLELGSGVGLTGLAVASCGPAKTILSDCHVSVLEYLRHNVSINASDDVSIDVENIAWDAVDRDTVDSIKADVILAADVVYDSTLFEQLIKAIVLFLRKDCCLYMACTERNEDTLQRFIELLGKECLVMEDKIPEQSNFFWSMESRIRLFKAVGKYEERPTL